MITKGISRENFITIYEGWRMGKGRICAKGERMNASLQRKENFSTLGIVPNLFLSRKYEISCLHLCLRQA